MRYLLLIIGLLSVVSPVMGQETTRQLTHCTPTAGGVYGNDHPQSWDVAILEWPLRVVRYVFDEPERSDEWYAGRNYMKTLGELVETPDTSGFVKKGVFTGYRSGVAIATFDIYRGDGAWWNIRRETGCTIRVEKNLGRCWFIRNIDTEAMPPAWYTDAQKLCYSSENGGQGFSVENEWW